MFPFFPNFFSHVSRSRWAWKLLISFQSNYDFSITINILLAINAIAMHVQEETVDDFVESGIDPLTVSLYQMDLDRTQFLLRSYLRIRIQKVATSSNIIPFTLKKFNLPNFGYWFPLCQKIDVLCFILTIWITGGINNQGKVLCIPFDNF